MMELTPEQIARIETPHPRAMWGEPRQVSPRFVRKALGNGDKLVGITPVATRPEYYVIRVDSGWEVSRYAKGEMLCEHMDEIYAAIEEQFSSAHDWEDEDEPGDPNAAEYGWPALDADCGSTWFEYEMPDRDSGPEVSSISY